MRRALVLALALLGGCDDGDTVAPIASNHEFVCLPCDGDGPDMAISTPLPVPVIAYQTWGLCFDTSDPEACWYDCPEPLNQKRYHGADYCKG